MQIQNLLALTNKDVENQVGDQWMDRYQAADYTDFQPGTFAAFDYYRSYNLEPIRIGKSVYYKKSVLDREFKNTYGVKLLGPKKAAKHISFEASTLATWRSRKSKALGYIKIGRSIRYAISELDRFRMAFLMPD